LNKLPSFAILYIAKASNLYGEWEEFEIHACTGAWQCMKIPDLLCGVLEERFDNFNLAFSQVSATVAHYP
jgi:hypothetical protein